LVENKEEDDEEALSFEEEGWKENDEDDEEESLVEEGNKFLAEEGLEDEGGDDEFSEGGVEMSENKFLATDLPDCLAAVVVEEVVGKVGVEENMLENEDPVENIDFCSVVDDVDVPAGVLEKSGDVVLTVKLGVVWLSLTDPFAVGDPFSLSLGDDFVVREDTLVEFDFGTSWGDESEDLEGKLDFLRDLVLGEAEVVLGKVKLGDGDFFLGCSTSDSCSLFSW